MNEYLRCRRDCLLGIKAYQNLRISLLSFERLCELIDSKDYLLISSFFYMGIIRYAKPFLNTKLNKGFISYPIKKLKNEPEFSEKMHTHLLELRNTLVAHDDFEKIEPRILAVGLQLQETDITIPRSICIENKCIAYTADLNSVLKIREHIGASLIGTKKKLTSDVTKFRSISIENPEQAKAAEKYHKNYGKMDIAIGGTTFNISDYNNEEWLNPSEPDFSEVKNGYHYESIKFRQDFNGPETIKLPNGYTIKITPSQGKD